MSRLPIVVSVHVQPDSEVRPETAGAFAWLTLGNAGDGQVILHVGQSPETIIGNVDRLRAALDELRRTAQAQLAATSYDPAEGSPDPVPDLAAGDHFRYPEPVASAVGGEQPV